MGGGTKVFSIDENHYSYFHDSYTQLSCDVCTYLDALFRCMNTQISKKKKKCDWLVTFLELVLI